MSARDMNVCNNVRLTGNQSYDIHSYHHNDGLSPTEIAEIFDVNTSAVFDVLSGKRWPHIKKKFFDENKRLALKIPTNKVTNGVYGKSKNRYNTELTEEQVYSMHTLRRDNMSHREIARKFGISISNTKRILSGKIWHRIKEQFDMEYHHNDSYESNPNDEQKITLTFTDQEWKNLILGIDARLAIILSKYVTNVPINEAIFKEKQEQSPEYTIDNKKYHMRGENNPRSKLTEEQVYEIHKCFRSGLSRDEIAKEFGVAVSTVSKILTGRRWGHVKEEFEKD